MCGIIGFNTGNTDRGKMMTDRIAHRGPDDEGVFSDSFVTLGNRRLAIIDLSPAGHQPMMTDDTVIAYNGEVYNYRELRQELYAQGKRFAGESDTEVILHGYEVWGVEVFQKLRGMFACAIYDKKKKQLILARDFFGIKPLYYFFDGADFRFASEIKGLGVQPQIGDIRHYFVLGYTPAPATIFKKIYKLLPGEVLVFDLDKKSIAARSRLAWNDPSHGTFEDVMQESVQRHLISDVPVGVYLSGGFDSTTIALMLQQLGAHLKAYTVRIAGKMDADYAKKIASFAGLDHQEIIFDEQAYQTALERCWELLDEPIADTSLLSSLAIARRASQEVKVVLTGEGADELFLGYDKYWKFPWKRPSVALRRLFGKKSEAYREDARIDGGIVPPITLPEPDDNDPAFYDRTMYLPDNLLYKTDFATMAYSVEGRVPFLDREVWRFSRGLSAGERMGKKPIREYLEKYLPPELFMRKKEGFSIPSSMFALHPDMKKAYEYARDFLPSLKPQRELSGRFMFALLAFYETTADYSRGRLSS